MSTRSHAEHGNEIKQFFVTWSLGGLQARIFYHPEVTRNIRMSTRSHAEHGNEIKQFFVTWSLCGLQARIFYHPEATRIFKCLRVPTQSMGTRENNSLCLRAFVVY